MEMHFVVEAAAGRSSTCRLGRHELRFDMPKRLGGEGTGPGPLAVFASTVGACAHYAATGALVRAEREIGELSVKVGAYPAEEGPKRLERITLEVIVPPGTPEDVQDAIELAVKSCPVYGTLAHLPQVDVALTDAGA